MYLWSAAYGSLVSGTYPQVASKNASGSTATDGTPFTKTLLDDLWGFMEALLYAGGFTSEASLSGVAESYNNSNILTAFRQGAGQPPARLVPFWGSDAEMSRQHLIECTGQTFNNANVGQYKALFDALEGSPFKSGNNITLPNLNGLFPMGRNSQTANLGNGYSSTYSGGAVGSQGGDYIRNITGDIFRPGCNSNSVPCVDSVMSGPFYNSGNNYGGDSVDIFDGSRTRNTYSFNASRVVPTGAVNKPGSFTVKWCITY